MPITPETGSLFHAETQLALGKRRRRYYCEAKFYHFYIVILAPRYAIYLVIAKYKLGVEMATKLSEAEKARALLTLLNEMSFKGHQLELVKEVTEWLQQIADRDRSVDAGEHSRSVSTPVPDVDHQRWR